MREAPERADQGEVTTGGTPLGRRLASLLVALTFYTAGASVVLVFLRHLDKAGPAPIWLMIGSVLLSVALLDRNTHEILTRGDLSRWLWVRSLVTVVLMVPSIYLPGWGPMGALGFGIVAVAQVRWMGSRAWIPATAGMILGTILGQIGIAAGIFFSYLPVVTGHMMAMSEILAASLLLGHLGFMVAARERTEEQVASQERRSSKLVQNASDVISLVDTEGRVVWISPSAERMLGLDIRDIIGKQSTELSYDADENVMEAMRVIHGMFCRTPDR